MSILVAFEEEYLVYQELITHTLRARRPHVEVSVAELDALEAEVARLCPHLVICSRPKDAREANYEPAWLQLPTGRDCLARVWLDGQYSEMRDPGLEELFRIVDEAEVLVRTN